MTYGVLWGRPPWSGVPRSMPHSGALPPRAHRRTIRNTRGRRRSRVAGRRAGGGRVRGARARGRRLPGRRRALLGHAARAAPALHCRRRAGAAAQPAAPPPRAAARGCCSARIRGEHRCTSPLAVTEAGLGTGCWCRWCLKVAGPRPLGCPARRARTHRLPAASQAARRAAGAARRGGRGVHARPTRARRVQLPGCARRRRAARRRRQ